MSTANFFFHGLFPDHIEANEGTGKVTSKVLFDVDFEGAFHSHLLADIWAINENEWEPDGRPIYEVRYDLPFDCDNFPKSVVEYYQIVMGPQATTISHSGPKGPVPNHNVYRLQWKVALPANSKKT